MDEFSEKDPLYASGEKEKKWKVGIFECLADPATCTPAPNIPSVIYAHRTTRTLQAYVRAAARGTASG
jgi:hypothetical protein